VPVGGSLAAASVRPNRKLWLRPDSSQPGELTTISLPSARSGEVVRFLFEPSRTEHSSRAARSYANDQYVIPAPDLVPGLMFSVRNQRRTGDWQAGGLLDRPERADQLTYTRYLRPSSPPYVWLFVGPSSVILITSVGTCGDKETTMGIPNETSQSMSQTRESSSELTALEAKSPATDSAMTGVNNVRGRGGGSKSAHDKTTSSMNATKHGIYSRSFVAGGELPEGGAAFLENVRRDLRPSGIVQEEIVDEIASILWRTRRVRRVENGFIDTKFEAIDDPDAYLDLGNIPTLIDMSLERDGCNLEEAVLLLDCRFSLNGSEAIDQDRAMNLAKLLIAVCALETEKAVRPTVLNEDTCSAAHVRQYLRMCSNLLGEEPGATIRRASRTVDEILMARRSREDVRLRRRRVRQREAILLEPDQVDLERPRIGVLVRPPSDPSSRSALR